MEAVLKSLMQSIPDLNAKRRVVHGQEPASIYASKILICPGEKSLDLADGSQLVVVHIVWEVFLLPLGVPRDNTVGHGRYFS